MYICLNSVFIERSNISIVFLVFKTLYPSLLDIDKMLVLYLLTPRILSQYL